VPDEFHGGTFTPMRHHPFALTLVALLACFPAVAQAPFRHVGSSGGQQNEKPAYLDPTLPVQQRVNDLISRMTLEEKVSQMQDAAPAIPRLGIPAYNWWNEALHGVARAGTATVFPQAIGLAATWDTDLLHRVADVISTEARAKYNDARLHGNSARYFGLTFWSPNINIFRDPRWGRGQETYGEDPFLTSRLGVAFVTGLQGDNADYLKTIATPKHFAVHSGPEQSRHRFNVPVSLHDLAESYLPAFRATIVEGRAASIMCAYNSVVNDPACTNVMLFEALRNSWGFHGYVVSDCGAVSDIFEGHKYVSSREKAAALAVRSGTDLTCGDEFRSLPAAIRDGFIFPGDIDNAVRNLFEARFRLGMFDPPERVPWSKLTLAENDTPEHRALALQAARESIVLLKNERNALPLSQNVKSIAVIGPVADSRSVLLGNYNGEPSRYTTLFDGIRKRFGNAKILHSIGSPLTEPVERSDFTQPPWALPHPPDKLRDEAIALARRADVIIAMVGITPDLEGEEMQVYAPGFSGGDRTSLDLPRPQEELLEALAATGKPLIVVLTGGSALAVNWAQEHAAAIVMAWYPGEEGGTALAELLAGDYNPSGRLPVTFYTGTEQLPSFENYSMANRTYRYFSGTPLYPFGFGLSYTTFSYSNPRLDRDEITATDSVTISVDVKNTGAVAGDEVVELYLSQPGVAAGPSRSLEGFTRIHLNPGEQKTVSIALSGRQLSSVDESGQRRIFKGAVLVWIGGGQPVVGSNRSPLPGAKAQFSITTEALLPE
jgi:beta-glucosidase